MPQARLFLVALVVGIAQLASAVNFDQCLSSINSMTIDGKVDNHGRPLPASTNNATAITYDLCVAQCGAGQEPFQWPIFSQQFSAWLLPWLALISQLPFGANDLTNNFESVFLTVGSPTLAAYSLALTALNGRWIANRFWRFRHYVIVSDAVGVLSSLQQSPLRISDDSGLASLIILPQNDQWWRELAKSLQYTHTWSIASVVSILWVVIAYGFTLVDYFQQSPETNRNTSGGSVGTLWLWLLPIVTGWLYLSPKCDSKRLDEAVESANNNHAHVANPSPNPPTVPVTKIHTISLDFSTTDGARLHERITAPIFNYARYLPWVQAVMLLSDKFENVRARDGHVDPIAPGITWHQRESGGWNQLSAEQVTDYCLPRRGQGGHNEWRLDGLAYYRMFLASILALILQWGTTGAAVVVVWFTPTIGLGCRSLSFIVYGSLSTLVWVMLLSSSIITFYSTDNPAQPYPGFLTDHRSRRIARIIAICLHQAGRFIAVLNTAVIVIASIAQFTGSFDRCNCNSSLIGLGKDAYNVISLTHSDGRKMLNSWIGGVFLALGAAIFFGARVGLLINSASSQRKKYPKAS